MNSLDSLKLNGKLKIVVTGPDGQVKDTREVENKVVASGVQYIASRMKDATATAMSHMAIGTGVGVPAAGDTVLTEIANSRVALSSTTASATKIEYVASFPAATATPPGVQGAVTEAGIFNYGTYTASPTASQIMLCRTKFDVINKGPDDTMTITWTINITAN